jgi:hypothetical protein
MNAHAIQPTVKLILGTGAVLAAPLFAGALVAGAVSSAAPTTRAACAAAPDPHRTLTRLVRPTPSTFTMAANSRRTLRRHPSNGSLYGALDLTGVPRGLRLPNGIAPRYRLIGSLRLDPVRRRMRVRAGTLKVTGRSGRHAIVLAGLEERAEAVALAGPGLGARSRWTADSAAPGSRTHR